MKVTSVVPEEIKPVPGLTIEVTPEEAVILMAILGKADIAGISEKLRISPVISGLVSRTGQAVNVNRVGHVMRDMYNSVSKGLGVETE